MIFEFVDAVKEQEPARISLEGPSGSGKTYTALSIARGLGETIGVIDTEHRSAKKFADIFRFKHLPLRRFDPQDLIDALAAAAQTGIDVVIIDSFSHFWMGEAGVLEQVDRAAKRNGGNKFGGWKDVRPIERRMFGAILAYPGHVIVTMRSKTDYVVEDTAEGKKAPKKIGLRAEQREGVEYEFDIVGALDSEHNYVISKSRMVALSDQVIAKPGTELGAEILAWCNNGEKPPAISEFVERARNAGTLEELRVVFDSMQLRELDAAPCTVDGESLTLGAYIQRRRGELTPPKQPRQLQQQPQQNGAQRAADRPRMATSDQKRDLAILIGKKLGITVRTERLTALGSWLGRPIGSFDDVTYVEAVGALADLGARKDHVPPSDPKLVESLRASIETGGIEELDSVMNAATAARDDQKITAEDWQEISDLVDARAAVLIADQSAERDWTPEAAQAPEAVGA